MSDNEYDDYREEGHHKHNNHHHGNHHHRNHHHHHHHHHKRTSSGASSTSVRSDSSPPISYVDFTHDKDTKFGQLLEQANTFLTKNLKLKAKCLECYELTGEHNPLQYKYQQMDTRPSGYKEFGDRTSFHFRCLRMWVEPKRSFDLPEAQTIGCLTIVPTCLDKGTKERYPTFVGFQDMIMLLNRKIESNPIEGKLLNIDTQYLKFHEWKGHIDPDQTYLVEKKQLTFYLTILKIFYILGPPQYETVGVEDFAPKCKRPGGLLTSPVFEEFGKVSKRAHNWIKGQSDKRILNIQTGRYKLMRTSDVDNILDKESTLLAKVTEHHVSYAKVLRVFHVTSPYYSPHRPPKLTYRTFHPAICKTPGLMGWPRYENQADNLERVQAFLRYTDAHILAAETLPVRLNYKSNFYGDEETSLDSLIARQDYQVLTIRLYLDGYYRDPPEEAMPSRPLITAGCCTIL